MFSAFCLRCVVKWRVLFLQEILEEFVHSKEAGRTRILRKTI